MLNWMWQIDLIRKRNVTHCIRDTPGHNRQVQNGQSLVILAPTVEGMLLRLYVQLQQATDIIEIER